VRELRALVVDDSSLNRRTIAAILKEIPGVTHVDVANDGADALRVVETNPPDFITLDLEMPRLDGYEFLQLLMDRHPLPVVVVSGLSAKENVFRALELGAIDFLEKPQGVDAPLESLRRQLVEKVDQESAEQCHRHRCVDRGSEGAVDVVPPPTRRCRRGPGHRAAHAAAIHHHLREPPRSDRGGEGVGGPAV